MLKKEGNELDSWMYQTVATDVVVAYSACMGLPLYRLQIPDQLKIAESGLQYNLSAPEVNEVEILYTLLYKVKQAHPELNAIVSGAILSNYQRLRVEHVCSRLGLISLSYLWEGDQEELLEEMVDADINAILVKVASIGLHPRHLGKTIAEMLPILKQLNTKYGVHICGEGGEFESLTLDCPIFRYKRLVLDETEIVHHDQDQLAPVAYMKLVSYHLEDKEENNSGCENNKHEVVYVDPSYRMEIPDSLNPEIPATESDFGGEVLPLVQSKNMFYVCGSHTPCLKKESVTEETEYILGLLLNTLNSNNLNVSNIHFVNVYLKSISDFETMNQSYKNFFSKHTSSSPSRACVSSFWDASWNSNSVVMEFFGSTRTRKNLHVQSISRWAPACIGPYAQGNSLSFQNGQNSHSILHLAGQIALQPSYMKLLETEDPYKQLRLSLKHQLAVEKALAASQKVRSPLLITIYVCGIPDDIFIKSQKMLQQSYDSEIEPLLVVIDVNGLPRDARVEIQSIVSACSSDTDHVKRTVTQKEAHSVTLEQETIFISRAVLSDSDDEYEVPETHPFYISQIGLKRSDVQSPLPDIIETMFNMGVQEYQKNNQQDDLPASVKVYYEQGLDGAKIKEGLDKVLCKGYLLVPTTKVHGDKSVLLQLQW
eukprot:TRINITY_DN7347_c0_g1_i1.p1 TRINITY_DN7347_c0_g1~~TRINITY_DN7347_c0_g1_i1.p1  ORF type:complete len:654 (+),score=124.44 TRINITY_DN7347_c0_g1_i1:55-2016(+)